MGRWGLSPAVVWAGEGRDKAGGSPGDPVLPVRGRALCKACGRREPRRSDEAVAGDVRLGPSGAAAGPGRGPRQLRPGPAPLLSQPPVLGSGAGAVGFCLGPGWARAGAPPGQACPDPPCLQAALALYAPGDWRSALGWSFHPRRPHCADRHMSSCYQPADTPGQLHVGVTRAEAPLPRCIWRAVLSQPLDLLSYTCWNKHCVFGEVA